MHFHSRKCIWKCRLCNGDYFRLSLNVLTSSSQGCIQYCAMSDYIITGTDYITKYMCLRSYIICITTAQCDNGWQEDIFRCCKRIAISIHTFVAIFLYILRLLPMNTNVLYNSKQGNKCLLRIYHTYPLWSAFGFIILCSAIIMWPIFSIIITMDTP